jgi:hypothetical protein
MGLDMYLKAEKYFWRNEKKPRIGGIPKGFEVKTVTVEAAYWRKANHIHAWFVKNVQNGVDNCQEYDVSHSDLMKLHKVCVDTLSNRHNAERDLPTQSGFFFGSTEYDEGYFSDLQDTIDKIEKVLNGFDFNIWSLTYRSSW